MKYAEGRTDGLTDDVTFDFSQRILPVHFCKEWLIIRIYTPMLTGDKELCCYGMI